MMERMEEIKRIAERFTMDESDGYGWILKHYIAMENDTDENHSFYLQPMEAIASDSTLDQSDGYAQIMRICEAIKESAATASAQEIQEEKKLFKSQGSLVGQIILDKIADNERSAKTENLSEYRIGYADGYNDALVELLDALHIKHDKKITRE